MDTSLAGQVAAVAAVAVTVAALWVLRRLVFLETAHAFLLSSAALVALCLGLAGGVARHTLTAAAFIYWPVSFWWLATNFGRRPRRGRARRGFLVVVLATLVICGVAFWGPLFPAPPAEVEASLWGRWAALVGVGFWLAALVNMLLTMRGAVGKPRLRRVSALAAFACLAPLWPKTVAAASGTMPWPGLWPVAGLGIVTQLALALWLLRDRPREGELQFERPVAYVSFAVFLLGIYLLLVGGVGKAVEWMGGDLRAFLSALGGVLIAILGLVLISAGRVWERIRGYVDRNFYRGEFDFRAEWMRISEQLATLPDPRDLGATLNDLLAQRLRVPIVFLYQRSVDGPLELWSRRGGQQDPPERLDLRSAWADWLWRLGAPTEWGAIDASDKPSALIEQTRLVVPLIAKQEVVALACLGGREEAFTAEERLWLEAAGQQAALAVVAASLTERLIEARELASYHRLSTFIIHDVKNAMSMLSLLLQNLEEGKSGLSDELARTTLRQATAKLSALVGRFAGARDELKAAHRRVDLSEALRAVWERTRHSFPRVECRLEARGQTTAEGDPGELERVIENLFINAGEAMQGHGCITATVEPAEGGLSVAVRDEGPGMDVDFIRERLFRPFATTKKKGLGIGLYQSREIVRAHGGTLTVESKPGAGSTFRLWLPLDR